MQPKKDMSKMSQLDTMEEQLRSQHGMLEDMVVAENEMLRIKKLKLK